MRSKYGLNWSFIFCSQSDVPYHSFHSSYPLVSALAISTHQFLTYHGVSSFVLCCSIWLRCTSLIPPSGPRSRVISSLWSLWSSQATEFLPTLGFLSITLTLQLKHGSPWVEILCLFIFLLCWNVHSLERAQSLTSRYIQSKTQSRHQKPLNTWRWLCSQKSAHTVAVKTQHPRPLIKSAGRSRCSGTTAQYPATFPRTSLHHNLLGVSDLLKLQEMSCSYESALLSLFPLLHVLCDAG